MALGHSGFSHRSMDLEKLEKQGCFYVVVSQGNSGNKVLKSEIIVLNFAYSMFLVNKGIIS